MIQIYISIHTHTQIVHDSDIHIYSHTHTQIVHVCVHESLSGPRRERARATDFV